MWRAFFLAFGISLVIIGAECLVVEQVIVAEKSKAPAPAPPQEGNYGMFGSPPQQPVLKSGGRTITPPDWAPWSLMGAGTVVVLYSFTIPRRVAS